MMTCYAPTQSPPSQGLKLPSQISNPLIHVENLEIDSADSGNQLYSCTDLEIDYGMSNGKYIDIGGQRELNVPQLIVVIN